MEFAQHPENTDSFWTEESLEEALKQRSMWQGLLENEDERINRILQNAWYPYQMLINQYFKRIKLNPGYELDSNLFVKDKFKMAKKTVPGKKFKYQEASIEIIFYWFPIITDDDIRNMTDEEIAKDNKFDFQAIEFNKRQQNYVTKIAKKFSESINMPVEIVYD